MSTQDLINEALKLKPEERFRIVEMLLNSLDKPDPEIDRLWTEEAQRRLAAHRRGELDAIPMEDIFKDD